MITIRVTLDDLTAIVQALADKPECRELHERLDTMELKLRLVERAAPMTEPRKETECT